MKLKKALTLVLSLLMLASCSKNGGSDLSSDISNVTSTDSAHGSDPEYLTHIFRGTPITVPEGYYLQADVMPIYAPETGNLTCYCRRFVEAYDESGTPILDENGFPEYTSENHILTLADDGSILNDLPLEIEDDENSYISRGILTNDSFVYIHNTYDPTTYTDSYSLVKYTLPDGNVTRSESLQTLYDSAEPGKSFSISSISVDDSGNIFLSAGEEIVVLNSDLAKLFSVFAPGWIRSLSVSDSDTVYAAGNFGFATVDMETRSVIEAADGVDGMENITFGDGYDFYYTDDVGLHGLDIADADEGETENSTEMVMNFTNSNILSSNLDILKIIDSETFLADERDPVTHASTLMLYRKADDVDLSTVKIIEVASMIKLYNDTTGKIIEYNKNHPETRIIVTDYTQYWTDDDPRAGENKLATDIVLGSSKPDIIIDYGGSAALNVLLENDLCTDLYTFIDKDNTITRGDLFGSVKRTFDNNGKLWGLTDSFSLDTLVGLSSVLGDRTSWTFSELLDYAASLPEGVELIGDLNQTYAAYTLFRGQGYGAFIDQETNTAHFDSPDFIKYLEYISTLPAESNGSANETAYQNGEIVLNTANIYGVVPWLRLEATFNTDELTYIGYPTADETTFGSRIDYSMCYVMTTFTEHTEEAWDFIKYLCISDSEPSEENSPSLGNGFPILKSHYDSMAEYYSQYEFDIYYSGFTETNFYAPENPNTNPLSMPGIRTYFTPEKAEMLKDILDNNAGAPKVDIISDEITAIVNEEISAYLAGTRGAEETADIVQSRVSIWLAEHE